MFIQNNNGKLQKLNDRMAKSKNHNR